MHAYKLHINNMCVQMSGYISTKFKQYVKSLILKILSLAQIKKLSTRIS